MVADGRVVVWLLMAGLLHVVADGRVVVCGC